jgi:hypothetical protein
MPDVFGDVYEVFFKPLSKRGNPLDLRNASTHPGLFNITERALWQKSVIQRYFTTIMCERYRQNSYTRPYTPAQI